VAAEPAEGKQKTIPFRAPEKASRRLAFWRRRPKEKAEPQEEELHLPQPSMTGWIIAAVLILLVSGAYALGLIPDWKTLLYGPAEEPLLPDEIGAALGSWLPPEETAPTGEGSGVSAETGAEPSGETRGPDGEAIRTVAELYNAMPPAKAGPLLAAMEPEQAVAVLRMMRREQAAAVLAQMEPNDAAELIRLLMVSAEAGGGQQ